MDVDLAELSGSVDSRWPVKVLVKAGVSFLALLDAHESIKIQQGESGARDGSDGGRLKSTSCVVDLLEWWVSCASSQPFDSHAKAKEELTRALETGRLAHTLCDLETGLSLLRTVSSQANLLLEQLRGVQNELDIYRRKAHDLSL
jgi:hypothetical protein